MQEHIQTRCVLSLLEWLSVGAGWERRRGLGYREHVSQQKHRAFWRPVTLGHHDLRIHTQHPHTVPKETDISPYSWASWRDSTHHTGPFGVAALFFLVVVVVVGWLDFAAKRVSPTHLLSRIPDSLANYLGFVQTELITCPPITGPPIPSLFQKMLPCPLSHPTQNPSCPSLCPSFQPHICRDTLSFIEQALLSASGGMNDACLCVHEDTFSGR